MTLRTLTTPVFALFCLMGAALAPGCGGDDENGGSGGSSGSSAGSQGSGASSTGGSSSGGTSSGGTSSGGSSTGGSNAGGASTGGSSGATSGGTGGGAADSGTGCGTTQCTNCIDDDMDGKVDSNDPECTGPADNDEGTFATGIPGDNVDPCKQDCFFDGNSGQGDDKCEWQLKCDPANPGAPKCPYDPNFNNCPTQQSQACIDFCTKLTPNGCDCFGCCEAPLPDGGRIHILLTPECTIDAINDPAKCKPCTQRTNCVNDCGRCELCFGKTELPADCTPDAGSGTGGSGGSAGTSSTPDGAAGSGGNCPTPICPAGRQACGVSCLPGCAPGTYCLTGCCIPIR